MEILGRTGVKKREREVTLGHDAKGPIKFTVRPVGYATMIRIEEEIPKPLAPMTGEVRRDRKGRPLKIDGKPVPIRDEEAPAYLDALDRRKFAIGVAQTLHAIQGQVKGVRARREGEDPVAYYHSIVEDFHQFGIDFGMFALLMAAVNDLARVLSNAEVIMMQKKLGTITDEEAEEAEERVAEAEAKRAAGLDEGNALSARSSSGS